MRSRLLSLSCALVVAVSSLLAQHTTPPVATASPWTPDNGDGTYTNPILCADYSDPDVIRVGDDYYMTSSSFGHFPGLPILHSRDLVNWTIIGHALQEYPGKDFATVQHGMGVWAPALRYHDGQFMIYFGDPDRGVFMTRTKDPAGPWEPLRLVRKVTGWIDPCPFWDEDGTAYLVHAFANSRAGIKSILAMNRMNPDGTEILDDGVVVFVGHATQPTIEGPKLYKRNGFYYIFAPAGGVKPGWQAVLRSRNVFGPYQERIVLAQGSTRVNGPHQGAWVQTQTGEDWFLHFQDRSAYGRVVHLQPMRWAEDWPVIGIHQDATGCGEPVTVERKPDVGKTYPIAAPQSSDRFDAPAPGLQWQWQAQPQPSWFSLTARPGWLRLTAQALPAEGSLYRSPAMVLQKFPATDFRMTAMLDGEGLRTGESSGLIVFGRDYASIAVRRDARGWSVVRSTCINADRGAGELVSTIAPVRRARAWLRVDVRSSTDTGSVPRALCTFSFSTDGTSYTTAGDAFVAREGVWVGARAGLFAVAGAGTKGRGHADYDSFVVEPAGRNSASHDAAAVRVMTWNIRYDNPGDGVHAWPERRDELLSTVSARQVDVLCIQEGLKHQVGFLKDGLTGFDVRGVGRDDGKEQGEYAAIYFRRSRFTCRDAGTFWLSPTPEVPSKGWDAALPRIVTWVRLFDSLARGEVYVFNTHFDHQGVEAREQSAALIREKVRVLAGSTPFVLTGDFNAGEKDSCYRILVSRSGRPPFFHDAMHQTLVPHAGPGVSYTGFPFVSDIPRERIDFIFVNDAAQVRRHAILDARRGPGYISDHLPVIADIILR